MRMETDEDGQLSVEAETDAECVRVGARVTAKYDTALKALLADLRPVFRKHGLNADDEDFLENGVSPLLREALWRVAVEEELLGGRF